LPGGKSEGLELFSGSFGECRRHPVMIERQLFVAALSVEDEVLLAAFNAFAVDELLRSLNPDGRGGSIQNKTPVLLLNVVGPLVVGAGDLRGHGKSQKQRTAG
jgi:hypothetical protein